MADGRCRAGAAQQPFKPALAASKRSLGETNRLTVVALGSSTTAGTGASDADRSYPAVLEAELRRRLPGREVKVLNLGVGGQSAYEMYLRLEAEVIPEKPALVIWQTAVNDAIRDIGEEKLAKILRKGTHKLQEAGIDLVLMDMPWLPREGRYPKYDDYRAVLAKTASESGVPVFPRYAMMKNWSARSSSARRRSSAWTVCRWSRPAIAASPSASPTASSPNSARGASRSSRRIEPPQRAITSMSRSRPASTLKSREKTWPSWRAMRT